MTRVTTVATAGHVFFELAAGVGMPFASFLGPVPAATAWAIGTGTAWHAAGNRPAAYDRAFTVLNSVSLAAVTAHLTGWPHRRTRLGIPWLTDCEGLGPRLMPYYNPILYLSCAAAVAALILENDSAPRRLPLLALPLVPLLAAAQHAEHRRLRAIAVARPAWWNRRLAERARESCAATL
ncbi:hypothetical protein [Streptomyces swartbergensis]|uniref:Uncharacterized protein n=1 Tax=Streptomyces swartbergensis TaxID=487165 RepID=A0A243S3E3_9ACTN|nr:hypothetical protein [Streptomyces swartbergensis]OUD01794.1 hypothetical protein CA983_18315 [Streptomyces swartbergensis]